MNSNLAKIIILFSLISCGVKGDPAPPRDTQLPSVLENYPDIEVDKPLNQNKKK